MAGAALVGGQRLPGAEREGEAEQPLHHPVVDLAGELDPLVELARALVLAGGPLDARRERGEAAEREHRLALLGGELEAAAAAVGEDHPEPAAAGRDRRAGDRGDPGEARVARRHLALEVLRGGDHPVLGQRALSDRRLVERALDLAEQRLVDAVRADRAHRAGRGVVEQQPGALHRRQPAERLADVVVELAGLGRGVELGDQAGEDLDRLGMGGSDSGLDTDS